MRCEYLEFELVSPLSPFISTKVESCCDWQAPAESGLPIFLFRHSYSAPHVTSHPAMLPVSQNEAGDVNEGIQTVIERIAELTSVTTGRVLNNFPSED
jgi:hypothetical protein